MQVNTRLARRFKGYRLVTVSRDMRDCSIRCRAKVSKRSRIASRNIAIHSLHSIFLFSEIVSIVVSIRVDKFYDKKVVWDRGLADRDSESYQTLAYEANRAVSIN